MIRSLKTNLKLVDMVVYSTSPDNKKVPIANIVLEYDSQRYYTIKSIYSLNRNMVKGKHMKLFPNGSTLISKKCLINLVKFWCCYINIRSQIYTEFVGD